MSHLELCHAIRKIGGKYGYELAMHCASEIAAEIEARTPAAPVVAWQDPVSGQCWPAREGVAQLPGTIALVAAHPVAGSSAEAFQQRVQPWMMACFGAEISADFKERNHRFLEEALELVQACDCTAEEAHMLVDYVYGRPVGEKHQEVGGVMVTLAALCLAQGLDMHECGETELARIWTKVEQIRAKQAAKPKNSPLPAAVEPMPAERVRSPYVLGVKPSTWDEQIAKGQKPMPASEAPTEKPHDLTIGDAFAAVGGWMNGGDLGYPTFGSMEALKVYTAKMIRSYLANKEWREGTTAPMRASEAQNEFEKCQHPDCGRFKDGAGWSCRAMRDNACARTAAPVPSSEAAKQALPQSECNAALRAAPAGLLNADELAALQRFDECAQDGEGYDVPKDMMQRLAEIGVVQRRSGAYYQATVFGQQVLGNAIPAPSIKEMVNNFLGWRLPADFSPDCGIGFDGRKDDEWNKNKTWPIGTNLLNADQARAMFEYVLAPRFRAEGGITNGSTTNLAAPTAPTDAKADDLLAALKGEIPLVEPVSIGKALRAGREARTVLASGTGPVAAVHLVNIGLTGWIYTKDTADAYAKGYNDGVKHLRSSVLEVYPAAQSVRDAALEEAARNVEDFQADNGEVSFNDIALSIRALIQSPSVRDAAQPFREPTDEDRHLEGVEKLMASAQPTIAPGKDGA